MNQGSGDGERTLHSAKGCQELISFPVTEIVPEGPRLAYISFGYAIKFAHEEKGFLKR